MSKVCRAVDLEAGLIDEAAEIPFPKLVDLSVINSHLGPYYTSSIIGFQTDALSDHRQLLSMFQLVSNDDFLFDENAFHYFEKASIHLRRNTMRMNRKLIQPLAKVTDTDTVSIARNYRVLHRCVLDTLNQRRKFKDKIMKPSPAESQYDPKLTQCRERLETAVLDLISTEGHFKNMGRSRTEEYLAGKNAAAIVTSGLISRMPAVVLSFDSGVGDLLTSLSDNVTRLAERYQFRTPNFVPGAITLGRSDDEASIKTPVFYVHESRYL